RNDAAAAVLLRFGIGVIPSLVPALNHVQAAARTTAFNILVRLVRQASEPEGQRKVLAQVVGLFAVAQQQTYAWYAVLELVANQFAEQSIPVLLQGLEHEQLRDGCAEALVRLVRKHDGHSHAILDELLVALRIGKRMVGAA